MKVDHLSELLSCAVDHEAPGLAPADRVKVQVGPPRAHRLTGAEFCGKLDQEAEPGVRCGERREERRHLVHRMPRAID